MHGRTVSRYGLGRGIQPRQFSGEKFPQTAQVPWPGRVNAKSEGGVFRPGNSASKFVSGSEVGVGPISCWFGSWNSREDVDVAGPSARAAEPPSFCERVGHRKCRRGIRTRRGGGGLGRSPVQLWNRWRSSQHRANSMQDLPVWMTVIWKKSSQIAPPEFVKGIDEQSNVRMTRGWKVFFFFAPQTSLPQALERRARAQEDSRGQISPLPDGSMA